MIQLLQHNRSNAFVTLEQFFMRSKHVVSTNEKLSSAVGFGVCWLPKALQQEPQHGNEQGRQEVEGFAVLQLQQRQTGCGDEQTTDDE